MGSKSKQAAARLGDIDTGHPPSPPTPIITGSANVLTNSRPAARKGDKLVPHHPGIRTITEGSASVLINGKNAARVSDGINCGGKIIIGSGNVLIGDKPEAPRNAKLEMEFDELMDESFKPEFQNLTPHQQAEVAANIAVKYRKQEGGISTWHEHYLSNNPAPGELVDPLKQKGHQRAQNERAKDAKEVLGGGNSNLDEPKNLEDAVNRLKLAREELLKNGYIPKYSDDELRSMAASGDIPQDRFIVRFSTAPKDGDGNAVAPEDNETPIGHKRDSGRHPLWTTTFDQLERADSDPKLIADIFGTDFNPDQDYVLYIIDRGEDFDIDGSDIFVPTFDNMKEKLKSEFAGDISPEMIDKVMTPEYAEEFREHWKNFNDDLEANGQPWYKSFNVAEAEKFAAKNFSNQADQEAFISRQKILSEIGAWEIFTGDGLTERTSSPGTPGVLETLEIQHDPDSVKDLAGQESIIEIRLDKAK